MVSQTFKHDITKLFIELENINTELLNHIKINPFESYDTLIANRDILGEKLKTICTTENVNKYQQELTNNKTLQEISQRIAKLDIELVKELDLVNYKINSKQQQLLWQMNNRG